MNLLDWFFPSLCLGCEIVLEKKEHYYCLQCKNLFRVDVTKSSSVEHSYYLTPALKKMIHHGKYKQKIGVFRRLAQEALPTWEVNPERLYLPVPLHSSRQRERGFNQAEVLAEVLAKNLGGRVLLDVFSRTKFIKSQTKLGKVERQRNVSEAFQFAEVADLFQKEMVIIDDIYTTGATTEALLELLPKGVNARIWTLAKTVSGEEFSDWEWEQMHFP